MTKGNLPKLLNSYDYLEGIKVFKNEEEVVLYDFRHDLIYAKYKVGEEKK